MKKSQKGFTIIEVSLVLAIGALIFLVVFLAVPALQRNSRNDARKRDVSNIVTAAVAWTSDNPTSSLPATESGYSEINGKQGKGSDKLYLISDWSKSNKSTSIGKYIDSVSKETEQVIVVHGADTTKDKLQDVDKKIIRIYVGKTCKGTKNIQDGSGRQMAVVGSVETAAGTEYYCLDAN